MRKKVKKRFFLDNGKNNEFSPIVSIEDEYEYEHCASFGTNFISLSTLSAEIYTISGFFGNSQTLDHKINWGPGFFFSKLKKKVISVVHTTKLFKHF